MVLLPTLTARPMLQWDKIRNKTHKHPSEMCGKGTCVHTVFITDERSRWLFVLTWPFTMNYQQAINNGESYKLSPNMLQRWVLTRVILGELTLNRLTMKLTKRVCAWCLYVFGVLRSHTKLTKRDGHVIIRVRNSKFSQKETLLDSAYTRARDRR